MPTTNIGACECCGGCTCTRGLCLWRWNTPPFPGLWTNIRGCKTLYLHDRPCCSCPMPQYSGSFNGHEVSHPCADNYQDPSNPNACACSRCTAVWDSWTRTWTSGSCSYLFVSNDCSCAPNRDGAYNGESVEFACTCWRAP
jgi:hypothetical protein